jgi:hypothetical protein
VFLFKGLTVGFILLTVFNVHLSVTVGTGGNMRVWHGFVLGVFLVPLALGLACPVQAAEVYGRASTVVEWYDSPDEDTAIPLHQYLQLNVTDIADKGYNFRFYGRLADDIENEVDVDSRLY